MKKKYFSIPCDRFFLWGLLPFLMFVGLVTLAHNFDWDHFSTAHEVELRSWLIDKRPPLWSYQFCAGVSRWGDPQSFGLSLLFLPTLILGSFFGPKFSIIVSSLVGLIFSYLTFDLLERWSGPQYSWSLPFRRTTLGQRAKWTLALFFILSQFFLWHFYVGHVTFMMFYWALAVVYFTLKGARFGLSKWESVSALFIVYLFFSGGFYHAFIYFLLPLSLPLAILLARSPWKHSKRVLFFWAAGLILSSYKWWAVLDYLRTYPRLLERAPESNGIFSILAFHFLPTVHFDFFWPFEIHHFWFVWENSFFCANTVLVVLGLLFLGKKARKINLPLKHGLLAVFIIALIFAMGYAVPGAPFPLFNSLFLGSAVRTLSRFNILITWVLTLVSYFVFLALPTRKSQKIYLFTGLVLCLLSLGTQLQLASFKDLGHVRSFSFLPIRKMRTFSITRTWAQEQSYMYGPTLSGLGVINCYNPLPRGQIINDFLKETLKKKEDNYKIFYLLDSPFAQLERTCIRESYVTQNDLVISPHCPPKLCVNLNGVNIYKEKSFTYNETHRKLCNF